jgi:NAD(P)-dependent dehydrogenase (short-subunit alcohol dehydrogenase family)
MPKVLITGGNKGIGFATTTCFLQNGYDIVIVARDFSAFPLHETHVQQVRFDLRQYRDIPRLVSEIGEIDILVNNAGILQALPYDHYPEDHIDDILAVNLRAPVALIQAFAPGMVQRQSGRIVNVASIAGQIGHPDIWYGITKAGVINATKSFAKILGPSGIMVNCVAPGPVEDTAMFPGIPDARKHQIMASVISGRFATPADVAETVYWLATQAPPYITGICVDINNGAFLR